MTHHLGLFCLRLERQREDILRGRSIRSDIMAVAMVEGTSLNCRRTNMPTRRESQSSKTAERGQEREASVRDGHNYEKCV